MPEGTSLGSHCLPDLMTAFSGPPQCQKEPEGTILRFASPQCHSARRNQKEPSFALHRQVTAGDVIEQDQSARVFRGENEQDRTRTYNLPIRGRMPCPLGHMPKKESLSYRNNTSYNQFFLMEPVKEQVDVGSVTGALEALFHRRRGTVRKAPPRQAGFPPTQAGCLLACLQGSPRRLSFRFFSAT